MTVWFRLAAARILTGGLLACVASLSPASAIPFSATFTYGGGTNQTYDPAGPNTLLTDATSVFEGSDQVLLTLTGTLSPLPGTVGDLLTYLSTSLVIPAAITGAIGPMEFNWGTGNRFSFISPGGTYRRDATNGALNFLWAGTFADSLSLFDTQPGFVTQSWSQSDAGLRPATGGVFSTLPFVAPPVIMAEPAGIGIFGAGLCAISLLVRRRNRRLGLADRTSAAIVE
ncbi:MAG TPA: hypothetical protein VNH44_07820 [Micropepsaceae bacterium]|nr:hypothetical protein [Micropepsaceae bacterium]